MFKEPNQKSTKRSYSDLGDDHGVGNGGMTHLDKKARKSVELGKVILASSSKAKDENSGFNKHQLQSLLHSIGKNLNKNLQERTKYPEDPEKFMDSEVDVDEGIKQLQVLSTCPHLYRDFVEMGGVKVLNQLLTHENTDILVDCIELVAELTELDEEDATSPAKQQDTLFLIHELIKAEIIKMVVGIMETKLDDSRDENESQGVHNCMKILENLSELNPEYCELLAESTSILKWLLLRLNDYKMTLKSSAKSKLDENISSLHPNKLYASEILAIFLQISNDSIKKIFASHDMMNQLLESIAYYRIQKPSGIEEKEVLENLFDSLSASLLLEEVQQTFRETEGIELMILFIKEKKYARHSATKVLDSALLGNENNCEYFLEIGGMKTLFALLMNKSSSSKKKQHQSEDIEHEEHVISMLVSVFKFLSINSNQIEKNKDLLNRMKKKFEEHNYEKTDRVMELFVRYFKKVSDFDRRLQSGELEEIIGNDQDRIFIERLDAGLFVLQQICLIIAFIAFEEKRGDQSYGLVKRVNLHLTQRKLQFSTILVILKEYVTNLGVSNEKDKTFKEKMGQIVDEIGK